MPRAGKLRNFITIQQATEAADSLGQPIPSWSTYAQVWAGLDADSGSETFGSDVRTGRVSGRFWTRSDDALTIVPKMRIVLGSRTFDIDAVLEPERPGGYREIRTTEVV